MPHVHGDYDGEQVECEVCGRKTDPETAYFEWYKQRGSESAMVCPQCERDNHGIPGVPGM